MWNSEKQAELTAILNSLSEKEYRSFQQKLTPGAEKILGVRVPKLKALAKEMLNDGRWEDFIESEDNGCYEQRMLKGLVIAGAKLPMKQKLELLDRFIPFIDNWAVCDTTCSALKPKKNEREILFDFAAGKCLSKEEFEERVGIVIIMDHFIDEDHIDKVFDIYKDVDVNKYYVDMALAWGISVCFVKFFEPTLEFFKKAGFSKFVHNKAISKCCDSYRISDEQKTLLRRLRIK